MEPQANYDSKKVSNEIVLLIMNNVPPFERGNVIREVVKAISQEMEKTAIQAVDAHKNLPIV